MIHILKSNMFYSMQLVACNMFSLYDIMLIVWMIQKLNATCTCNVKLVSPCYETFISMAFFQDKKIHRDTYIEIDVTGWGQEAYNGILSLSLQWFLKRWILKHFNGRHHLLTISLLLIYFIYFTALQIQDTHLLTDMYFDTFVESYINCNHTST